MGRSTMSSTTAWGESLLAASIIVAISLLSMILLPELSKSPHESVITAPGLTAVTLMPCGFNSSRRFLLNPSKANLLIL